MTKKKKKRSEGGIDWLIVSLVGVVLLLAFGILAFFFVGRVTVESVVYMATPTPLNQFTETFDNNARGWQLGANSTIANGVLTLGGNEPLTVPYQPTYGYELTFTYITGETSQSQEGIGIIGIDVEDMDADEITNTVLGQLNTTLPPELYVTLGSEDVRHRFRFSTSNNLVVYEGASDVIAKENIAFTPATRIRIDNAYDYVSLYINEEFILSSPKPPANEYPQPITFLSDPTFDNVDNGKQVVIDDLSVR